MRQTRLYSHSDSVWLHVYVSVVKLTRCLYSHSDSVWLRVCVSTVKLTQMLKAELEKIMICQSVAYK